MNRREAILVSASALAAPAAQLSVRDAGFRVPPGLTLERKWSGNICRPVLVNPTRDVVRVDEVAVFTISHSLPSDTQLYGESFQMLSQTGGTLGRPTNYAYDELKHYRIPQPAGVTAISGMMTLTPPGGETLLLAYTSCRRFHGRFFLRDGQIEAVLDCEGLEMQPGEKWDLEEFLFASGRDRELLLAHLAATLNRNHPPLRFPAPPTGWCSWYCFGPRVTAQQVLDNLDAIAKRIPGLKYVQIDDGYQPAMGDWLETGKAFGGDVLGVLKAIRDRGFEPAIWVAPFIAEAGSHVFQQHPDWFMKGADGAPLPSSQVTFQGWRRGPWYALDGTHPGVQKHFEQLFRTMRREWGCSYFKMDANFWGAMHGGRLHDRKATRIQAYRRGMEAIRRGAGDGFLLGCNHPIWASMGLIHGSRSSGDIRRAWNTIRSVARQNLSRNWQNGRLWWNDSDAVLLTGTLPLNEFVFHATAIYASGGMVLSGDDLSKMPDDRLDMLRKLIPPNTRAAVFDGPELRVGMIDQGARKLACLFNWGETVEARTVRLERRSRVKDFWTGEDLGTHAGTFALKDLQPRSARLLVLERA